MNIKEMTLLPTPDRKAQNVFVNLDAIETVSEQVLTSKSSTTCICMASGATWYTSEPVDSVLAAMAGGGKRKGKLFSQ